MADNVFLVAIVQRIVKWASMFAGTRNEVKTLYALPVLDVASVLRSAPGEY